MQQKQKFTNNQLSKHIQTKKKTTHTHTHTKKTKKKSTHNETQDSL